MIGSIKGPASKGPASKSPASYFAAIKNKYGQPMQHWFDVIASLRGNPHLQIVAHQLTTTKGA